MKSLLNLAVLLWIVLGSGCAGTPPEPHASPAPEQADSIASNLLMRQALGELERTLSGPYAGDHVSEQALLEAKRYLTAATAGYGGHREAALSLVTLAIKAIDHSNFGKAGALAMKAAEEIREGLDLAKKSNPPP